VLVRGEGVGREGDVEVDGVGGAEEKAGLRPAAHFGEEAEMAERDGHAAVAGFAAVEVGERGEGDLEEDAVDVAAAFFVVGVGVVGVRSVMIGIVAWLDVVGGFRCCRAFRAQRHAESGEAGARSEVPTARASKRFFQNGHGSRQRERFLVVVTVVGIGRRRSRRPLPGGVGRCVHDGAESKDVGVWLSWRR